MTDAPDPGLTDLIAAHYTWREVDEGGDYLVCVCGHYFASRQTWAEHLKLVVEQHTNGRIAELEAAVVRVEKALEAAEKSVPDDWGVTYIYTSQLRAALEGEQQ